jgi:3'(2'), 5'-bisphosphate nucleotidase
MKSADELDIDFLIATAREAGAAILDVYRTEFDVEHKEDSSPLTEADLRSHRIILSRLAERYPDVPVLSEESGDNAPYEVRRSWSLYFLVDPLDGTKEFVKRNGQFTVNIALMEHGKPVAGVVYAPDLDWMYFGSKDGSFKAAGGAAAVRLVPPAMRSNEKVVVVGSRSHSTPEMGAFIEGMKQDYGEVEFIAMGSSLKLCTVAEGKADIYPRLGPTMEWDTAAAHAVVTHSGRRVLAWGDEDSDLPYNKPDLLNGWFIVR